MNPTDPNVKADIARLETCLAHLGEHFDAVHIFATRHESGEEGGTIKVQKGVGNWYARYGQIVEFLVISEEDARCYARKEEK
jgi:hypothetical protein